jgi:hypothetical protein
LYDVPKIDTGLSSDDDEEPVESPAYPEVSTSLYNPAKYGPNGTLVLAAALARTGELDPAASSAPLPMSPIVSSMGPQVLSRVSTSPTPTIGKEPRMKPVKAPLCKALYNVSSGEALVAPRPATALCSLSGRPVTLAKKYPTTDYDYAVAGTPGSCAHNFFGV